MKLKSFFKDYFISPIASIFGIKTKITLLPVSDLTGSDEKWISTGIDPAFLLKGNYFWGWNQISWESDSEKKLPVKIYWDCGGGFSERESKIFTTIPKGSVFQKSVIYIPKGARQLRIDPGEQTAEFTLKEVKIKKVSRVSILIHALFKLLQQRGYTLQSSFILLKRAFLISKNQGFRAIWFKVKNYIEQNVQNSENDYKVWIAQYRLTDAEQSNIRQEIRTFQYQPLISIIVPVYNVEEIWLRKCIESVINQMYPYWELCIADDASTKTHVQKVLEEYAARDSRIKVVYREKNGHISESSNSALEIATGEFIGLLDHDDELTIDALYENVKILNEHPEADMIYSDEDKISVDGERHSPYFKPNWSPDLILSQMYTCHFGVYRTKLVKQIGGFRKGFEGSQDYDLVLRLSENTNRIFHIPKILYHWRTIPQSTASGGSAKDYTTDSGLKAIKEALARRNINGWVEPEEKTPNLYIVHYNVVNNPKISIIIPTRNMSLILDQCLKSIFQKTTYANFEVIIIDNGSDEQATFDVFQKWSEQESERFSVIRLDVPFNYSLLNNQAVMHAKGSLILLLNNDVEVITPTWLEEMAGHAQRTEIGAVGACLLYPDNTIQHAGIILGIGGVAGHSHKYFDCNHPGYFSRLRMISNYSAVTAACLMVRKSVFNEVGGLEESLSVAFNDVDFCLKIRQKGYYNVWLPHVKLYHYESKSRGQEDTPEKRERFRKEIIKMQERWGKLLFNDPFYSPHLSLTHENYSINLNPESKQL